MESKTDYRYFTFPIRILDGAFDDIKKLCDDIFDYSIYKHSLSMELGTEKERMQSALSYYGITAGNLKRMTENGKLLNNSISDKTPLTSLNKDLVFEFYKCQKNELQIACFLAFAAIKSILGKKEFCKTNKELIIARMFGYSSINDLPEKKHVLFEKYTKRYNIDKVLYELQIWWHLKLFSDHCRGFYLSYDLSLEQLAKINIEAKNATKLNELRNAKKEALRAAKESLNIKEPLKNNNNDDDWEF